MGGKSKPLTFALAESLGTLTGSAEIKQSDWGIKPYSALFGALKVDDEVKVVVEAKLGERVPAPGRMQSVRLIVAHIAGIPLEETLAMAVPILGATYVALMASLRSRRRSWKRD